MSLYTDIIIYILIIIVFIVALFLPYPSFGSKKNKKDESK
jgi:flagellar basal body-associated protein FliL